MLAARTDSRQTNQEVTAGRTQGLFGELTLVPNITAERQLPRSWGGQQQADSQREEMNPQSSKMADKHKSVAAKLPQTTATSTTICLNREIILSSDGPQDSALMTPHLRKVT